jgi:hypothetical protein
MVIAPVPTPVTTPVAETVALVLGPPLHVPPVAVSLSVAVEPVHTVVLPDMVPAEAVLLTVIFVVTTDVVCPDKI